MSISGVSGTDSTNSQDLFKEIRQDISNLQSSLKSNNLSGAKTAFSALEQLLPDNSSTNSASSSDSFASTFKSDIDTIGKSLSSGDLAGAQQAFSNLESLVSGQQSDQTAGQTGSAGDSGQDPIATDLNNLSTALQSGNLTGAQTAFKQLTSDLTSADPTQATGQIEYGHHHGQLTIAGGSGENNSTNTATGTVSLLG